MARDETPLWDRGQTWYNGGTASNPPASLPVNIEGKEYEFEDNLQVSYAPAPYLDGTGRRIRVKVARNSGTVNLLPGRIARYQPATSPLECRCDGYYFQAADSVAGVVDEFLPPAGVAPNDYFFLIIDGPTHVIANGAIAVGQRIEAATGTSQTDPTAGLVMPFATTPAVADLLAKIGHAQGAATAANQLIQAVVHFLPTR